MEQKALPGTWEECATKVGVPVEVPSFNEIALEWLKQKQKQVYILHVIHAAIIGDWKADYSGKQKNYIAVMFWDTALGAFRFSYTRYYYTHADAGAGARFAFSSAEEAEHFARLFEKELSLYMRD